MQIQLKYKTTVLIILFITIIFLKNYNYKYLEIILSGLFYLLFQSIFKDRDKVLFSILMAFSIFLFSQFQYWPLILFFLFQALFFHEIDIIMEKLRLFLKKFQ